MKRVITHGCSFTKYKWSCWPNFLSWFEEIHVQNYGFSASGNETIARGVVNSVMKFQGIQNWYIIFLQRITKVKISIFQEMKLLILIQ